MRGQTESMTTATETQEEFLTLKGELERKTLEELGRLLHLHNSGDISKHTLKACVQTVWQITAGLVEREIMNATSQTIDGLKTIEPDTIMWLMHKGDSFVVLMWQPGTVTVKTWLVKTRNVRTWEAPEGLHRAKLAKEQFARIYKALLADGYVKL